MSLIAIHYQLGKMYHKALYWHYKSASILEFDSSYEESIYHLIDTYTMYDMIRRKVIIKYDFQNEEMLTLSTSTDAINSPTVSDKKRLLSNEKIDITNNIQSTKYYDILSNNELNLLFNNDSNLLEYTLQTLIKLAQFYLLKDSNTIITITLYESAYQIIRSLWNLTNNNNNTYQQQQQQQQVSTSQICFTQDSSIEINNDITISTTENILVLKDISIIFPVLSGLILHYELGELQDDNCNNHMQSICKIFLDISQSQPQFLIHELVARYLNRHLYITNSLLYQSVDIMKSCVHMYNIEIHSKELIL